MTTSTNETSAHSMPVQQSRVPQQQRHLDPTFIASQPKIRDVKLSPNGGFILYQVTQFYRSTSRPLSTLWLAETNKPSSAIPVTGGEFNDRSGVFHPDGTRILFLSDRQTPGKKSVIYQLSLVDHISSVCRDRSGDADEFEIANTIDKDSSSSSDDIIIDEVLTCPIPKPSTIPEPTILTSKFTKRTNIREFQTSPSGELVGFLADNDDDEEGIATETKKNDVDVIELGSSSSGQTKGRLLKLGVYNFTTDEIRMLETRRDKNQQRQLEGFTWSSDSKTILYRSRRNRGIEWPEQVDQDQVLLESISVAEEGAKPTYLASYPRSPSGSHVWLSTGHIASLQSYEPQNILDARTLHVHHLSTKTTERIYGIDEDAIRILPAYVHSRGEDDLTKNDHDFLAVEVGNDTESRIDIIAFTPTSPTHLSRFTLFQTSSNAIWFNSWDVRRVTHPSASASASSSNPTTHVTYFFTAVLSSGPYHEPPNVWSGKIHIDQHNNENHKFKPLSRSNQNLVRLSNHLTWLTKTPILKTDIIYWKNKDGIQLSGLVRFPPDYDTVTHGRIPTILFIHGGPYRRDIPGAFYLIIISSSS